MADQVVVCWAPECGRVLPPSRSGRPRQYCNGACRIKAIRRNGGKAPDTPFPPLEPTAQPVQTPALDTVESRGVTVEPRRRPPRRQPNPPRGAAVSPEAAAPLLDTSPAPAAVLPAVHQDTGHPASGEPAGYPASSAEDLDPKAPTVPVPFKPHPMVEAYRTDLQKLGALESRDGQKVLEMATKLTSSAASPAASAGLSKELDRLMGDLEAKTQPQAETDAFNVIRERTLRKLGVVGVQAKLP